MNAAQMLNAIPKAMHTRSHMNKQVYAHDMRCDTKKALSLLLPSTTNPTTDHISVMTCRDAKPPASTSSSSDYSPVPAPPPS